MGRTWKQFTRAELVTLVVIIMLLLSVSVWRIQEARRPKNPELTCSAELEQLAVLT